jgi:hypothetical protein
MKLGLITDIHEHTDYLRAALDQLRSEGVDQIVVIGDVFRMGERLEETCRLLSEARAVGVWGNHDFGLSFEPGTDIQDKYGTAVIGFMTSLKPRLEIDGCYFAHIEPWLNAEDLCDLWYFDGLPDNPEKLVRIFEAVPNRLMFAGHYHTWLLATPDGIDAWTGENPVSLADGRFFIVVDALCEGSFATFDTESSQFVPFSLVH